MSNRKKNLTISFSLGNGYDRDIKKEFVSLDEGVKELERDLHDKYGCELKAFLNGTPQKREIKKAVHRR